MPRSILDFLKGSEEESVSRSTGLIDAKTAAQEIVLEAKNKALEIKRQAEEEAQKGKDSLEKQEVDLVARQKEVSQKLAELDELRKEELHRVEKVAELTQSEARERVLEMVREETKRDAARVIKEAKEKAEFQAETRAKDILISAIQRAGTDYVAEYTTSWVKLPDEDFKGRIIGREGRNIRALEQATGVDIDIDETPGKIRVSSFDGVRREVARLALERLLADGRLQPSRIEEGVAKARRDLERDLEKVGEKLVFDAGVIGISREIFPLLGRFKFRTSYGQNLITHSLEVLNIGKYLAAELGLDVELVKKACLLHDIGKVKTAESGGLHTELTRQILERHKFDEKLINAAAAHHEDEEFRSPEAMVVHIADAVSGARPGARFEDYEEYIARMRGLEETARSFEGVREAYALAAGREVRVVVIPEQVEDAVLTVLAHDIVNKIQQEHTYPGQVKVTVIKKLRATEIAK